MKKNIVNDSISSKVTANSNSGYRQSLFPFCYWSIEPRIKLGFLTFLPNDKMVQLITYTHTHSYGIAIKAIVLLVTDMLEIPIIFQHSKVSPIKNDVSINTKFAYKIIVIILLVIDDFHSSEVSSSVSGEYIFLPLATGLTISDDTDDLTTTVLAYTSSSAVVKMDPENMTSYSVDSDAGDLEGQQILAAWAELTVESTDASGDASGDSSGDADTTTTSNLIVVSSASFLDDSADSIVSGNNLDLFSDFISAMISDEDSSSISIAVKEYSVDYLTITSRMAIVVSMAFTVILPIVLIIIGIVIWVRRRKR